MSIREYRLSKVCYIHVMDNPVHKKKVESWSVEMKMFVYQKAP